MYKRKTQKPLTPRQLEQYKRMQELGVFARAGEKGGNALKERHGNEYFSAIRKQRKNWRKGLEDGNAHTES